MEDSYGTPYGDIFYSIAHGKVRQIETLIKQPEVLHFRKQDGKTPLMSAVLDAREDIRTHLARMFVRSGSDVNARDGNGRTALMYACMEPEKIDVVRVLSRCKKCDPNIQDMDGYTAVMHAVLCANASALRVLLNSTTTKSVINLGLQNEQKLNAIDLCVKLQMAECCKVLVCDGAVNIKKVKNRVELMRLIADENANYGRSSNTPHSMNHSRNTSVTGFRKQECPIPEDDIPQGKARLSRDVTPYADDSFDMPGSGWGTPMAPSRSNSEYRSNSSLRNLRSEVVGRPSSLTTPNEILGILNSQRNMKRALTPISRESPRHHNAPQEDQAFGHRTRLPSIPSGRKLYLVSSPNGYTFNGRHGKGF